MDYKTIESINEDLKKLKIDIKGKKYSMVKDKIIAFRKHCPDAEIDTDITYYDGKQCTIKCVIKIDGKQIGSGVGEEKCDGSFINKTSFVENCETSAIGRALSSMGIGIEDSYASGEEVANAMLQNEAEKKPSAKDLNKLEELIDKIGLLGKEIDYKAVLKEYDCKLPTDLTLRKFDEIYGRLMATMEQLEKGAK